MESLQEAKKSKDQEIEKYKKYLNKAKKIIENIGENKTQKEDSLVVRQEEMRQRQAVSEKEAKKHGEKGGEWDKGRYREIVAAVYFLISKYSLNIITKTTLWLLLLLFSTSLFSMYFCF